MKERRIERIGIAEDIMIRLSEQWLKVEKELDERNLLGEGKGNAVKMNDERK